MDLPISGSSNFEEPTVPERKNLAKIDLWKVKFQESDRVNHGCLTEMYHKGG